MGGVTGGSAGGGEVCGGTGCGVIRDRAGSGKDSSGDGAGRGAGGGAGDGAGDRASGWPERERERETREKQERGKKRERDIVEKERDGGLGAHGVGSGTTGGGATGGGGVSGSIERKGEREIREEGARGKKRSRNTGELERQEGERGREREKQEHNDPSQTSSSAEDRVYGTRPRKRPKADAREGPCLRADAGDDGSSRRPQG
jgi:hypothetical protein